MWNEAKESKSVRCLNSYFESWCVDIGDLWFKLFEPVSFYYVSDCNNDNNGRNKIQEKENTKLV